VSPTVAFVLVVIGFIVLFGLLLLGSLATEPGVAETRQPVTTGRYRDRPCPKCGATAQFYWEADGTGAWAGYVCTDCPFEGAIYGDAQS
jgi:hypothetical protein